MQEAVYPLMFHMVCRKCKLVAPESPYPFLLFHAAPHLEFVVMASFNTFLLDCIWV